MKTRTLRRAVARGNKVALLLSAAAVVPLPLYAASDTYTGPTGNWSSPTYWSLGQQPGNGDTVLISNGTGGFVTVTYDVGATATSLAQITVDSFVSRLAGYITLGQPQGTLTITGNEFVGNNAKGALNLSGGTHTVNNDLYFGFNVGSSGAGSLSGNGVLNANFQEYVGDAGSGSFTQSGGNHTAFLLAMGYIASGTNYGSGIYTQTGGTLNVTSGEYVGYQGNGIVNQSGGVDTAASLYAGFYANGANAASSGVYSMSNGASLTVNGNFWVGVSGSGVFNQTGGNASASAGMSLGQYVGGAGTVNFSGGTLTDAGNEYVGNAGTGTFNQTGGTHTINSGILYVGANAGASGAYTLSNGTLALTKGVSEYVGYSGTGTFNQSGGTHTINAGKLFFGNAGNGSGAYTLSNGTLTLNSSSEYVGEFGNGTFNQSGGTHTINNGSLLLGSDLSSSGAYNLGNGTLALTNSSEVVGVSGSGVFNQTGGTHTIDAGNLYLGNNSGSGAYTLNNGTLALTNNSSEYVGYYGSGTFNQSGGTHTINGGGLTLGYSSSGSGAYTLGNGTLALTNGAHEYVGNAGTGTFNQTGGTHTISSGSLYVGAYGGSSGTYTLSNGTLALTGADEYVGYSGTGTFNQSGGTNTIDSSNLYVGAYGGSSGTYTLSNGTLALTNSSEYVGLSSTGTFNQSGGNHSIGGALLIASESGSRGSYNLSGGTVNISGPITIGRGDGASTGSFTMTGGTLDPGPMTVNPNGSYVQSGGSATVLAFTALAGGTAHVGGGLSLATFTASSITADKFTVANNGLAQTTVLTTPHSVTNTIGLLSIATNNALLDIDRQDLLLDNARTPFSSIHNNANGIGKQGTGMWDRGYNYLPSNGFGVWDGTSGLTSSTARASHQVDARISVGYIDGRVQNDPNIGDLGIGLATNRIKIRPSLNGDLNLDGKVDGNDIGIIIGLGYFGAGSAPHGWLDGDINGDGVVDGNDIGIIIGAGTFNNGSYGPTAKTKTSTLALPRSTGGGDKTTPTLSGSGAAVGQSTTDGLGGDGKFDYLWANHDAGDLWVYYDGDTRITSSSPLQRLRLLSASGLFNPNNVNDAGFNFESKSSTELDLEQSTTSIPDHYDIGDILPPGADPNLLLQDLTLQFNVKGGGLALKTADLVGVPEPSTLALVGIGAIGLLARRRRTVRELCISAR